MSHHRDVIFKSSRQYHHTTFKVAGNCGMCKNGWSCCKSVKGVKALPIGMALLKWSLSHTMSRKPTWWRYIKKIAAAGCDTELVQATDESYNSLHGCCHYDRLQYDKKRNDVPVKKHLITAMDVYRGLPAHFAKSESTVYASIFFDGFVFKIILLLRNGVTSIQLSFNHVICFRTETLSCRDYTPGIFCVVLPVFHPWTRSRPNGYSGPLPPRVRLFCLSWPTWMYALIHNNHGYKMASGWLSLPGVVSSGYCCRKFHYLIASSCYWSKIALKIFKLCFQATFVNIFQIQ